MTGPLALRFVSSFSRVDDLPATRVELALVGRSNVGKSSLINALAGNRRLARTSKTPGATRLLNSYELGARGSLRWLIDMPGYGYARASDAEKRRWSEMAEDYLQQRDQLRAALHLIDGVVGPTALDLRTAAWLDSIGLPVSYAATKIDKVRSSRRSARHSEMAAALGVQSADIQWVSAVRRTGVPGLRTRVSALLSF